MVPARTFAPLLGYHWDLLIHTDLQVCPCLMYEIVVAETLYAAATSLISIYCKAHRISFTSSAVSLACTVQRM